MSSQVLNWIFRKLFVRWCIVHCLIFDRALYCLQFCHLAPPAEVRWSKHVALDGWHWFWTWLALWRHWLLSPPFLLCLLRHTRVVTTGAAITRHALLGYVTDDYNTKKMFGITCTVTPSGLHCIQCAATYNVGMAFVRKYANRETSIGKFLNNYCCNTYVCGWNVVAFNNIW